MSVDLYVAVPASSWPTIEAAQQCLVSHAHPVQLKRFPGPAPAHVVTEGILATIDGKDAYLEGALGNTSSMPDDVEEINDQLVASGSKEKVKSSDILLTFHLQSPLEMRAASYVISALIVCFHGFGFEPQGSTSGRADFAKSMILGAEALKGL